MQVTGDRRTNRDRTAEMRSRLLAAARALFVGKGYAETGTPEIVAAAGVTRGALYHHFPDKRALFRAVVEAEAAAVAAEVASAAEGGDALAGLLSGARAYLAAMAVPGRTRLLLLEAPAVLGAAEARSIDEGHAERTLREGLAAAMRTGDLPPLPLEALTSLLSAMFDRAALDAAETGRAGEALAVIEMVLAGLSGAARGDAAGGGPCGGATT